MSAAGLSSAQQKMADAGISEHAIRAFARFYELLESGASGMIAEAELDPIVELPTLESLDADAASIARAASECVLIKLNGGLGTSMGIERAKSLLPAKGDLSFLDIIVRQVLHARKHYDARLPVIFMNSFRTHDDALAALNAYPDLPVDALPLDFLQNREPKLLADTLEPVSWPAEPELEWCPPGHGDLYPALVGDGLLDTLRERGFRYAFCSNADNLAATFDARIPAWMAANRTPFVIESTRRTPSDRKGGHLAIRRSDGRMILRETAQTSPEDIEALRDLDRHRFTSTNNIWIDLDALAQTMAGPEGGLDLPLIRNVKTVDPRDRSTPKVIQIESAMGAAIASFDGARSVLVDRSRFVPVKTTNDLLVLRSDAYELREDYSLAVGPGRQVGADPIVDLDAEFFATISRFDERFAAGPVSLLRCDRFEVSGDISFGADVSARGEVRLSAPDGPRRIEDGTVLDDTSR